MGNGFFSEDDIISVYTSEQAAADDILKEIPRRITQTTGINYVTMNLARQGYLLENGDWNYPNLVDLVVQCKRHIVKTIAAQVEKDWHRWFYALKVELPSGEKIKVWVEQNETRFYTILLPEDH